MAVNASRSMAAELAAGVTDGTYMQLAPNWNTEAIHEGIEATERLDWPTYARVQRGQAKAGWLVDTADYTAVKAAKLRTAIDHQQAPLGNQRHTHVNPGAYKFSQDQKGAFD